MKRVPVSEEVTTEVDGKTYTASFTVKSGIVTVDAPFGSQSTQVGGSPAKVMARLLLSEIVLAAKSRGLLA